MGISAKVMTNNADLEVKVTPQDKILVTNFISNAKHIRIDDLYDVNAASPTDGSLLIFNSQINRWVANTTLDSSNQLINGGHF